MSANDPSKNTWFINFSKQVSLAVILIGLVAILGWIFQIESLKGIWPGMPTIKVNTALSFILGGVCLRLWHCKFKKKLKKIKIFSAFLIVIIASLTIIQYSFDVNIGIDELFMQQPEPIGSQAAPGRMAPNTALGFLLSGLALVFLNVPRPKYLTIQVLGLAAWLIAFLGLLGYVYGSVYFYTAGFFTGMAIHTSIAFLLLSSGILCACPDRGIMTLVSSDGVGSLMARRLLPAAIAIPLLIKWLCGLGYQWKIYSIEMATSLESILNAIAFVGVISWNTYTLNKIDRQRQQAELAQQQLNTELEQRVEERTAQLRTSEEMFRQLAENIREVFFIYTFDYTQLIYISPAYEQIWGRSCESLYQKPDSWLDSIHPEDLDNILAGLQRQFQGEPLHQEYRIVKSDGSVRWILSRSFLLRDRAGEFYRVVGFAEDITSRKIAQAALQESHQRITNILESITDAFFSLNSQWRFTYLNPRAQFLFKRDLQTLLGKSIWDEFPELVGSTLYQEYYRAMSQKVAVTFEEFQPLLNRWLEVRAYPFEDGISVYLTDISSRKQTQLMLQQANADLEVRVAQRTAMLQQELKIRQQIEEALRASQARFAGILEIASDAIISVDANQRITLFNQGAEKIFGYKADEVLGKPLDLLLPERFVNVHRLHVNNFGESVGKARRMGEGNQIFGLRKDGTQFPAEASISKLEISGETVFTAFLRDVTEPKQAEGIIRESEERFRSAFDYAAIGMALVGLDGSWLKVNHSICEITGYSEAELLATTFQAITHPEDLEIDLDYMQQMLAGEIRTYQLEKRYFHKQGHVVWILLSGSLVRDTKGEPLYFIAQIKDITERKRAEAALRQSEERYRAILEDQTELITRFQPDGTLSYVNEAYCRFFGKKREELIGKSYEPIIFEEDREKIDRLLSTLNQKNPVVTIENRVVVAGGVRWTQWINRVIFDDDGNLVELQSVGRDITDRKQAEEALRASEQRFHAIFNLTFQFVGLLTPDGILLEANQTALDFASIKRSDVVGRPFWEARWWTISPATQNQLKAAIDRAAIGEFVRYEVDILGAGNTVATIDFSLKPVKDETGKVTMLIPEGRDISDRKQMELELRSVSYRLQFLLTNSPAVIFSSKASGDYGAIYISENSYSMLGYQAKEFLEDSSFWINRVHPDDIDRILAEIPLIFQTGEYAHEYRFLDAKGTFRWLYAQMRLAKDESGNPTEIVGYLQDISDRKQAEELLKASLKEKEVLLREIHHRVKNNMQIIYSLLRMQARRTPDEQTAAILKDSQDRIKSMALVHEKLYRSQDLAEIDLKEYVQSLAASLFSSYGVSSKITIESKINQVLLDIDTAIPCGLILNELISNSLKYAFPGNNCGKIEIEFYLDDNKNCVLLCKDNGVGIPADFDIEETKSLGLKLVSGLVNQLDGTMEINSNKGTEFKIVFAGGKVSCL